MKTALLVVDIVNSCCSEKCEIPEWNIHFSKIRKMVRNLVTFISEYKKQGGYVIYINCVPWQEKNLPDNIVKLYKNPDCCYYTKDKTGFAEEFYQVKPEEDTVITKNSYDAFSNPELDKILKQKGIRDLIITGVFGEGCVNATINGAFSKGYNVTMIKNLIETRDNEKSQMLLTLLKENNWPYLFGAVVDSEKFLFFS